MKFRLLLTVTAISLACFTQAFGQGLGSTSPGPQPTPVEPVDPNFMPEVTSKADALEIVSVVRRESMLRLRIKNVSAKNIYGFRMAYHKSGQSLLFSFILWDDKTYIAPGEVYKYDYPYLPNSVFAREPLIFEAVLFEDGTGEGVPDRVKSLQDMFLANRKELEHLIATIQAAISSADVETLQALAKLINALSHTPDYMHGVDTKGLAGLTFPSWKADAMHMVREIEREKSSGSSPSIRDSLFKIKETLSKSLAKYPGIE